MMTRSEIINETRGTDFTPIAHYTSEPYEVFGADDQPFETTTTVDVKIVGDEEIGYG